MKINIRNEWREWVNAGCAKHWLLNPKRGEWEKFYPRFCASRIGYFLHLVGYRIGWHTSLICDPLHSGSFLRHMRSFLWNLWHVDIWWPLCNKIDRWRRPEFYKKQDAFFHASWQAMEEGFADPMPPPGFPAENFHGSILGERYFKRLAEILKEKDGLD